jgi:hypothetical protein
MEDFAKMSKVELVSFKESQSSPLFESNIEDSGVKGKLSSPNDSDNCILPS